MKKIVFISHYFPRLPVYEHHGSWALDQAIAISENFEITVVTIKPKIYWFMKMLSKKFKAWANVYDNVEINKNLNIQYVEVNPFLFKSRELLYRYPEFLSKLFLKKYLKSIIKLCPDLLIGNHTLIEGLVCKKIKEMYNIPYIAFEHSPDDFIPRNKKHKLAYQSVIESATCFVNVSKYSEESIGKYYNFDNVICKVLYNYSKDAEKWDEKTTTTYDMIDFKEDKKYLLNIAAYEVRKNQLCLVDFISENINELEDWELLIVGGYSKYYNTIKKYIIQKGLENKIHLISNCPHHQVLGILRKADIFVLPSESEMFSVAVLEALSAGLPVVVTSENGTSDKVFDQYSLIRFDPGHPDIMSNELLRLIKNKEIRQIMGVNNRKLYEDYFIFEKYVLRMKNLIKAAMNDQ